jgi:hypothetical protein
MALDVFISYSTKDKSTADAICAALEANGIRCWIAPRDIQPGNDWGESIIDAIHACRAMVLVFSANYNASSQIKREIERAMNVGIPVVPFRIEDVLPSKTLEYFISTQHWLDALTPPLEQHLQYLATTMRAILAQKVDGSEAEVREPQLKPHPAGQPDSEDSQLTFTETDTKQTEKIKPDLVKANRYIKTAWIAGYIYGGLFILLFTIKKYREYNVLLNININCNTCDIG